MAKRRLALQAGLALTAASFAGSAQATPKTLTPSQPEGPFYPTTKPQKIDADLTNGHASAMARGERLRLSGQVLDRASKPQRGIIVEIWQADYQGIYHHPGDARHAEVDAGFAGYGEATTDAAGNFTLQTIVPVPYTSRPPHIHVRLMRAGAAELTTQLYIAGHPSNDKQGIFSSFLFSNMEQLLMHMRPAASGGQHSSFDFVI